MSRKPDLSTSLVKNPSQPRSFSTPLEVAINRKIGHKAAVAQTDGSTQKSHIRWQATETGCCYQVGGWEHFSSSLDEMITLDASVHCCTAKSATKIPSNHSAAVNHK